MVACQRATCDAWQTYRGMRAYVDNILRDTRRAAQPIESLDGVRAATCRRDAPAHRRRHDIASTRALDRVGRAGRVVSGVRPARRDLPRRRRPCGTGSGFSSSDAAAGGDQRERGRLRVEPTVVRHRVRANPGMDPGGGPSADRTGPACARGDIFGRRVLGCALPLAAMVRASQRLDRLGDARLPAAESGYAVAKATRLRARRSRVAAFIGTGEAGEDDAGRSMTGSRR